MQISNTSKFETRLTVPDSQWELDPTRTMRNQSIDPDLLTQVTDNIDRIKGKVEKNAVGATSEIDSLVLRIHMAYDELIMNAIRHGHQCNPRKVVYLTWKIARQNLMVYIQDQGDGFDPKTIQDPTLDENLDAEGGRGILMATTFSDTLKYNQKGNGVLYRKSLTLS